MDNRLKPFKIGIRSTEDGLQKFAEAMRAVERREYIYPEIGYTYFENAKAFKNHLLICLAYMQINEKYPIPIPKIQMPGVLIRDEMEARGWSEAHLALLLGKPEWVVEEVLSGEIPIVGSLAKKLGWAFNVPEEFFINLQIAYDKEGYEKNGVEKMKELKDALELIGDVGCGYDGCGENVKCLQKLIDELVDYARNPEKAARISRGEEA